MGNRQFGATHLYQEFEPHVIPREDMILKVWVHGADGLSGALSGDVNGLADPYVQLQLDQEVDVGGLPEGMLRSPNQEQETSRQFKTLHPKWSPPELFMFWIPSTFEPGRTRLVFNVMDWDRLSADEQLGNGFLKLSAHELVAINHPITLELPLFHPDNNQEMTSKLLIDVQLAPRDMSFDDREDVIIEYERWRPARGWGSKPPPAGHFVVGDPGRYLLLDASFASQSFAEMEEALPIRAGYEVSESWFYVTRMGDNEGWQYAVNFDHKNWKNEKERRTCVRRRFWVRRTHLVDPSGLDVPPEPGPRRSVAQAEDS